MSQPFHTLFNNIFSETHAEFNLLQQDLENLNQLQVMYLSNENENLPHNMNKDNENEDDDKFDELDELNELNEQQALHDFDKLIFSLEQVNKFYQIYQQAKFAEVDDDDEYDEHQNLKNNLNKFDEEAQKQKLQITECCQEKCLQTKIDHDDAIMRYQNFNQLTNNEKNMFFKGILAATNRGDITTKGQKRKKLANEYSFEGIKICNSAFLVIYGIGSKKWKNIRKHYIQNDINPRKHKLEGCSSNHSISFEDVLEILTFIMNYANSHGLPSPSILNFI